MPESKRPRRKRVLIIEDHPVFSDGLASLLNHAPGLRVCGAVTTAHEGLKEFHRLQPDLVIVDIGLPDQSGFGLIPQLAALPRKPAMLVVSAGDEMMHAITALRLGAGGYVMKHEGPDRLLEAVREVLAGKTCVSPRVTNQVVASMRRTRWGSALKPLSTRELAVLGLIGDGLLSVEIARRLNISRKTVESYRTHLRHKLGLATGHDLLFYAVRWRMREGDTKTPEQTGHI